MQNKRASVKRKDREVNVVDIETAMERNYNKLNFSFKKRPFKFTQKQQEIISAINNPSTKIVIIEGPAGTSKTYMAVYCGLTLLKENKIDKILYLRSVVESASKSMGYLPGDSSSKMSFFTNIIDDKLFEAIEDKDISMLHKAEKIETMPLNYIRGCSWRDTFIIADEVQNFTQNELLSTLTRIGEGSIMVMCGDRTQSDIRNSGFPKVSELFNDDESKSHGIVSIQLTEEDIVRSEIVKFIVKKFKEI